MEPLLRQPKAPQILPTHFERGLRGHLLPNKRPKGGIGFVKNRKDAGALEAPRNRWRNFLFGVRLADLWPEEMHLRPILADFSH